LISGYATQQKENINLGAVWAHRRAVRPRRFRWNEGAMHCKVIIAVRVCIPLANRRSLVSPEAFIVDSTFFAELYSKVVDEEIKKGASFQ
jgi:hypothetical protein